MGVIIKNGVIYGAGQSSSVFKVSSTLLASNWSGNEAPYTQAISINNLNKNDDCMVDLVMSGTYSTDKARREKWNKIYRISIVSDNIVFYSKTIIGIDLPINIIIHKNIKSASGVN